MHELSVIKHIADTLEVFAEEHEIKKILTVRLDVGEVSGILYDYFDDCWNYFREKTPLLSGTEMRVRVIPAFNHCEDCGCMYRAIPQGRICPECGSPRTVLAQGNEIFIREVEVEDPGEKEARNAG